MNNRPEAESERLEVRVGQRWADAVDRKEGSPESMKHELEDVHEEED